MNIQSLRNKIDDLLCENYLEQNDIIVLVETWLYASETPLYNIEGYSAVHCCRETRGGGAAIYIRDTLKFSLVNVSNVNTPCNWICISLGKNDLLLSVIYRPPSCQNTLFFNDLESILVKYPKKHVIVGDINIIMLENNSSQTKEYTNLLALNGFTLLNNISLVHATRVTDITSSIIDHVICSNAIKNKCKVTVEDNSLSDHRKITLSFRLNIQQHKKKCILKRLKLT